MTDRQQVTKSTINNNQNAQGSLSKYDKIVSTLITMSHIPSVVSRQAFSMGCYYILHTSNITVIINNVFRGIAAHAELLTWLTTELSFIAIEFAFGPKSLSLVRDIRNRVVVQTSDSRALFQRLSISGMRENVELVLDTIFPNS